MVSSKTTILPALKTATGIDPVYEMFVSGVKTFPFISYIERNNVARADGDTIRISDVYYTIKIFAKTVSDIETYSEKVDDCMLVQGFKRAGCTEMVVEDNIIMKVFDYHGTGIEVEQGE